MLTHALLLADEIHTFSDRREYNDHKRSNDVLDIVFCINHLAEDAIKMPNDLLYSENDWAKVKEKYGY